MLDFFRNRDEYPLSYVIDAAKEDARAQDELADLAKEAASLIFELAEQARAYNEELPRRYRVSSRKHKGMTKIELRQGSHPLLSGGASVKVAELTAEGVQLKDATQFIRHVNSGLIGQIGEFFVERCRRSREETRRLGASVEEVRVLKQLFARQNDGNGSDALPLREQDATSAERAQ
jgi:hypothetical protein